MTTVKEFEEQKESIMSLVTDEIINNTSKETVAGLDKVNQLIRELQPPSSTCSTCYKRKSKCNILFLIPDFNKNNDFGCLNHPDYKRVKK